MMRFNIVRVLLAGALLGVTAAGQTPAPALAEMKAEMKKVDFLVGRWQGKGWFEFGPGQRRHCTVTEEVQSKLDGLTLVIEGLGKSADRGMEGKVIHHALAVLSWDAKEKRYRMSTHKADGLSVDAEARVVNGAFEWGFRIPHQNMQIRYTIRLTGAGEWHEVGEMSMDGKAWRQFFEMTLQRQQ